MKKIDVSMFASVSVRKKIIGETENVRRMLYAVH